MKRLNFGTFTARVPDGTKAAVITASTVATGWGDPVYEIPGKGVFYPTNDFLLPTGYNSLEEYFHAEKEIKKEVLKYLKENDFSTSTIEEVEEQIRTMRLVIYEPQPINTKISKVFGEPGPEKDQRL